MLISAPPLTPYHRLGRTFPHRTWRPIVGTIFIVGGGAGLSLVIFGGYAVVAAITGHPADADGLPSLGLLPDLALDFLMIAALLPVVLAAARWIQRRPAGSLSSVTGRLRLGWLMTCLPVAVVAIVLMLSAGLGVAALTGEDAGLSDTLAGWGPFAVGMGVLVLVVPLQAAAEEYLTRGWLLQAVGAFCRAPWLPIGVQAVVFAALHGWGTPWGFADLIVFGAVAGWLTVRTGGLEAAIALHVVNNLIGGALSVAYGDLAMDETAADMPWQLVVVDVPVLIAYAAVVVWLARRRAVAERTAPAPDPMPLSVGPLATSPL